MLQGDRDGYRGQRRNFLPNHPVNSHLRLRCNESNHMTQRSTFHRHRRRGHFHLAGNIDVVGRIGLRIILAIFCERGKARDGNEQEQHTYAKAKPPVGCDFAEKTCLLLLNIHARIQRTTISRERPKAASTALPDSFILRLLRFRKQQSGCNSVRRP